MFNRGQRWNSDFQRDTRDWNGIDDFEAWISKFWRKAKHNIINEPQLFKDILFDRIYEARGKYLGELITPEMNPMSSALKYYLQIRRLVIPIVDPEVASGYFYNLKQSQHQTVDKFFQQKLKTFRMMYLGVATKRQWKEILSQCGKMLSYSELAADQSLLI